MLFLSLNILLYFREAIKIIPTGGHADNGRLILTKVIDGKPIKEMIVEIIKNIRFPAYISIDGNGFLEKTNSEDKTEIIFCFASPATGIELGEKGNLFLMSHKDDVKYLKNFAESLNDEEFLDAWFRIHDRMSDFRGSGIRPRRIINLVIQVDPIYLPVTKLI